MAEKAAWEFAQEKIFDLIVINPSFVFGKILQPIINTSSEVILHFATGKTKKIPNIAMGFVDVQDVALGHVLAYKKPDAKGRYILTDRVAHYKTIVDMLRKINPEFPLPTELAYDAKDEQQVYNLGNEKAKKLGVTFKTIQEQLKSTVVSLKEGLDMN